MQSRCCSILLRLTMVKTNSGPHHPHHIYSDNTWYFITAAVYQRRPLLKEPKHKTYVREQMKSLTAEFRLHLSAWVILDNHYHVLVKLSNGLELSRLVARLHGSTSYILNKELGLPGRKFWNNYWDVCVNGEGSYWRHFNYIHHNPVKHGYVDRMENWEFSSYCWYLQHKGLEWLNDTFMRYPIIDYSTRLDI